MREYGRLSPYDFELFIRDLLGAELGVRLESFAPGPDQGVDLRYLAPEHLMAKQRSTAELIVQCKHYAKSGYSALKSSLANSELAKIAKLLPKRLIIATSNDLTPKNKAELFELMSPFISSEGDILGAGDLEGLLNLHPAIERAHYKLWLTSSAVLEAVLHSKIHTQTHHLLDDVERSASRYVLNSSYESAKRIIERTHVCMIVGRPGIGKTTLAQMLLLGYIAEGYEPVLASEDVSEANALWNPDPDFRQIFYYDDFLGQATVGDKLGKNEDSRLRHLIRQIVSCKNKLLILTTREYILEQAKQEYEQFGRIDLSIHRHVLKLDDYTKLNRAQILFNHLYFSEIPGKALEFFVASRCYSQIATHPNYTPRLIEDVVGRAARDQVDPARFSQYFLSILDDPEALWQHPFDNAISDEARLLLEVLASMPVVTTVDALRGAFDATAGSQSRRFLYALRELDGDFLTTQRDRGCHFVEFANPSIRDFVLGRVFNDSGTLVRLLNDAKYFEQILLLDLQTEYLIVPHSSLPDIFLANMIRLLNVSSCPIVANCDQRVPTDLASRLTRILRDLSVGSSYFVQLRPAVELLLLQWNEGAAEFGDGGIALIEYISDHDASLAGSLAASAKSQLAMSDMELSDAEFVSAFVAHFPELFSEEENELLAGEFEETVRRAVENVLACQSLTSMESNLEHLRAACESIGQAISEFDEWRIVQHTEFLDGEERDYYERRDYYGHQAPAPRTMPPAAKEFSVPSLHVRSDDALIDDMFGLLVK